LALGMSTAKGVTAFATQVLASRGELDVDRPVAHYWPAFAANGKADITVAMALLHTAGLPWFEDWQDVVAFDDPESWLDYDGVCAALARSAPVIEPGKFAYHPHTVGWILGEVIRAVTGERASSFIRREVAEPLGVDMWISLPEEEDERVAVQIPDPVFFTEPFIQAFAPGGTLARVFMVRDTPPGEVFRDKVNTRAFRAAEAPSGGLVSDARSVARMYAEIVAAAAGDDSRLVSPASVELFGKAHIDGAVDPHIDAVARQGYGYFFGADGVPYGGNPNAYGAAGVGGATSFVDPDRGIAFAYVMNQMVQAEGVDPRVVALSDAVRACADARAATAR
jgi:CubicO group peptidase (beta-lactamase class C family)